MNAGLARLLRPKSIAVVGGGAWCASVIRNCADIGFMGPVWSVHPTRSEIEGVRTVKTVDELPSPPDAVFIGVNRHATLDVVKLLADMGAGGAICFASGFAEAKDEDASGDDLQSRLLACAGEMPVIGPNCYGFINYLDGAMLWPDYHGGSQVPRGAALITQSSNIAINLTMQRRGLPLAYVVTVGNQAQTGLTDIAIDVLSDPRVTALGLHVEGISNLAGLQALAETAQRLNKPIVVLKVGASQQAQAATMSHTASLAGSAAGASALFTRLGIAEVATLPALLETLKFLHINGPLPNADVASMSCSGGEASLMADAALGTQVRYPPLNDTQNTALAEALGPIVKRANPLDYHTFVWSDRTAMAGVFAAMVAGTDQLGLVVIDYPRHDKFGFPVDWRTASAAIIDAKRTTGARFAVVASLPENMPEEVAAQFAAAGIAPLCGLNDALVAIEKAADLGMRSAEAAPLLIPQAPNNPQLIAEDAAKALLAGVGLACPDRARAASPDDAVAKATRIGFPVVLKALDSAHKSDTGGVHLNLKDAAQVRAAAAKLGQREMLVEAMISGALAELLIGVVIDPAHGYVLTLGAGGVQTEILNDTASLLIPSSRDRIHDALRSLKTFPLLTGYRGRSAADIEAVLDAIEAVQTFVIQNHGRLAEVEINPLLCRQGDAIAADALIRMDPKT